MILEHYETNWSKLGDQCFFMDDNTRENKAALVNGYLEEENICHTVVASEVSKSESHIVLGGCSEHYISANPFKYLPFIEIGSLLIMGITATFVDQ
ncbi:hypothetical protein TNCV_625941 [Trichonephila clavipes]|nr:hypothetical protein TNCV_625941 [Trichonephila clavipes]